MDIRLEGEKEKGKAQYLVGFTVDHQIKGVIKEPVTTLKQAKEWQRKSTHSKVNLNTGEWAKRKKKGQEALVNVSLVSQRKKSAPPVWMEMEGVTEAGAIGGSKQFPGVFNIVDKGVAEYGSKKVYMLEIWLWGKVFNGRFLFRELSIKGFAELKKLAKEFQEFSDEEEFNELVHDLRTLGDDEFEKFYGTKILKDVKTILGLPEDQAVEKFYARQFPNSPSFAHEAAYGRPPEEFLPARSDIPADTHIKKEILDELNTIPEIEVRAVCEGHNEKYVSHVTFRLKEEDPAKAASIAEALNKFEGYYSKADIGPEGKCRIVCAARTWFGKGGDWNEFWKNLASKIKQALETAERGKTLDKAGKPLVLPVAETAFREELNWFFIKPLDQTPYSISDQSVKKKWVPPEGFSCLPKHVRSQVPEEYRYWRKGLNTSQRMEMRNALVEKMKSEEVKIDMEKVLSKESVPGVGQGADGARQRLGGQEHCYCPSCDAVFRHVRGKPCTQSLCPKCGQSLLPYSLRKLYKAKVMPAKFVYQLQGWKGPKPVRAGYSTVRFFLRMKVPGEKHLRTFRLTEDLIAGSSSATFQIDKNPEAFTFKGDAPPGHFLNPREKETTSFVEVLDKGDVVIYQWDPEFRKFELKGEKLRGLFAAIREDPKSEIWTLERSKLPKTEKSEVT